MVSTSTVAGALPCVSKLSRGVWLRGGEPKRLVPQVIAGGNHGPSGAGCGRTLPLLLNRESGGAGLLPLG